MFNDLFYVHLLFVTHLLRTDIKWIKYKRLEMSSLGHSRYPGGSVRICPWELVVIDSFLVITKKKFTEEYCPEI